MPRCKKSSSRSGTTGYVLAACLLAGPSAQSLPATAQNDSTPPDSRQTYSHTAPPWLSAVGKLQVPGSTYSDGVRSHLDENCSATLITHRHGQQADTIITAWHCLEKYDDLSKPILFTLPDDTPGSAQREAYRLADGGGMHADWALLRLRQPIKPERAGGLIVHPGRADPARIISMAGYSRDEDTGDEGNRLSFDPACSITDQAATTTDSDCIAHKGASGGAVVQLTTSGAALLSGVVSEGNGVGFSIFVPVSSFRSAIGLHLR